MAQRGRSKSPNPGSPGGGAKTGPGGSKGGPAGGARSTGTAKRRTRQSVASARRTGGNRTQLIIGGVAIVVIIAIIAVGLWMHAKNTAIQGSGYGTSTESTASADDKGIITVSNGNPALVLDIYEDALCPICREFEEQYGQQLAKAIDQGDLTVRYHMVDFLNRASTSGTYSTRAYSALLAVARGDGAQPGIFMRFHSALFNKANQPVEVSSGGKSDLSNAQLASLAGSVGVAKATQEQISAGAGVDKAQTDAASNLQSLTAVAASVGRTPGTPTVAKDGKPLDTRDVNWLTKLLPKSDATGSATSSAG